VSTSSTTHRGPRGGSWPEQGSTRPAGWPTGQRIQADRVPPAARIRRPRSPDRAADATHLGASAPPTAAPGPACHHRGLEPPRPATARDQPARPGAERHAAPSRTATGPSASAPASRPASGRANSGGRVSFTPAAGPQRAAVGTHRHGRWQPDRLGRDRRYGDHHGPLTQRHISPHRPALAAHSRRIRGQYQVGQPVTSHATGTIRGIGGRYNASMPWPSSTSAQVIHKASCPQREPGRPVRVRVRVRAGPPSSVGSRPPRSPNQQLAPAAQIVGAEAPQPFWSVTSTAAGPVACGERRVRLLWAAVQSSRPPRRANGGVRRRPATAICRRPPVHRGQ